MGNMFELNCSNMVCPMPVAKTKKKLAEMENGDILEVRGDFLEASENIARYAENHGAKVLECNLNGENYHLKIQKL